MPRYKIAGCIVEYTPVYSLLQRKMEKYFWESGAAPDIMITTGEGDCLRWHEKHPVLSEAQCEYLYVGAEFYRKLLAYGGFMLHSSAVVMDDKAYLFSADSGVGKSTHTKQWQKKFGDRAEILNDDKPAVCVEEDGTCVAWGTPFSGKSEEHLNRRVLLQGICMIERGEENRIWRISAAEAIPLVLNQTLRPRQKSEAENLLSLLDVVFTKVPVYRMQCTVSEEAAGMAYEMMSKNSLY